MKFQILKPLNFEILEKFLKTLHLDYIHHFGTGISTVEMNTKFKIFSSTVINDFDEDIERKISVEYREEYLAKVAHRVQNYEVKTLNDLRENKKLLVLDIDYTLFDHKTPAETGAELMRPHLHDFLTSAYKVRIVKS